MMSALLPYLDNKNFLVKFGTLILLMIVFFVITNTIGIVLAIPFFGLDILSNFNQSLDYTDKNSLAFMKYLQVISQIGVFILPAYFFAYLNNRQPMNYLRLRSKFKVFPLVVAMLIIFVSIPFINYLVKLNEQMTLPDFMSGIENWMRNMENQATLMTQAFLKVKTLGGLFANLIVIAFLAAIGEELLFRGVILKMLNDSLKNIHLAVIISAIIFSAFHGQFYGFIPRAVLGVLFGYIFIWTGNLWIPILLHLLFNSVSVVVAYLFEVGSINTDYEDFGESSGVLIVLISLVFTIFLMFILTSVTIPILVFLYTLSEVVISFLSASSRCDLPSSTNSLICDKSVANWSFNWILESVPNFFLIGGPIYI